MFIPKNPGSGKMSISIIGAQPPHPALMPQNSLLSHLNTLASGMLEDALPPIEVVDHPPHYRQDSGLEAIDAIEAWDLNFNLGNVVKYVCRAGVKSSDTRLEDLEKALWYLTRELENAKGQSS